MTSDVNARDLSEREADANALEGYRQMVAELRERLEAVRALAEEWEGWARLRSTPRIDAFRDAAEAIRTALDGGTR